MPEAEFLAPNWVRYPKHRKCGPRAKKLWERSILAAQTEDSEEPSVYDPNLSDADIMQMELGCVAEGLGTELPRTSPVYRRFYRRFENDIGASQGKKTKYILVQYNQDGSVHGYPVTANYLAKKGADIHEAD